jgi:hypothetical protein
MKNFFLKLMKYLGPEKEPTEDELKLLYSQMTEEAFRKVAPADLTAVARKAYDAELTRRRRR